MKNKGKNCTKPNHLLTKFSEKYDEKGRYRTPKRKTFSDILSGKKNLFTFLSN